jgi:hypothetical protein
MKPIRNILCPTVHSSCAREALADAIGLARFHAEASVVVDDLNEQSRQARPRWRSSRPRPSASSERRSPPRSASDRLMRKSWMRRATVATTMGRVAAMRSLRMVNRISMAVPSTRPTTMPPTIEPWFGNATNSPRPPQPMRSPGTSVGVYQARLGGQGYILPGGTLLPSTVHVTAAGPGNARCKLRSWQWTGASADYLVNVDCYGPGGVRRDSAFNVIFMANRVPHRGDGVFLFAHLSNPTAQYTPRRSIATRGRAARFASGRRTMSPSGRRISQKSTGCRSAR